VGYFSHSFRRSLGVAPHKWLIEQRVVLSKEKLRDDGLSLSDVATECGLSDQSHLTRVFTHSVGVSPGAWRRGSPAIASESYYQYCSKSGSGSMEHDPATRMTSP
jgi:AraC-like DNA-binding protein